VDDDCRQLNIIIYPSSQANPPGGYHYDRVLGVILVTIGMACALGHWLFTRLFWNQRAKKLNAKDSSSKTESQSPRWVMWLFCFIYIPIFSLITPIGAVIGVENAWGAYRWHQVRTRLELQGEKLYWKDWIREPVAPDQNFASLPILQEFYRETKHEKKHLKRSSIKPKR
jgi:hypothetical protein